MALEGGTEWSPNVTVRVGVQRYSKGCHLWLGGEGPPGGGNMVSDPVHKSNPFWIIIVTDGRDLLLFFCTWTLLIYRRECSPNTLSHHCWRSFGWVSIWAQFCSVNVLHYGNAKLVGATLGLQHISNQTVKCLLLHSLCSRLLCLDGIFKITFDIKATHNLKQPLWRSARKASVFIKASQLLLLNLILGRQNYQVDNAALHCHHWQTCHLPGQGSHCLAQCWISLDLSWDNS